MRIAIAYPPLESGKGVALLTQNRQFQWFSRPTYIFPVVPATAATMLKRAGHDVCFLDGIAAELPPDEFDRRLEAFRPDVVVLETKTPVVKRHWRWIDEHRGLGAKFVLVGDHVTALPDESIVQPGVWAVVPGGDWDYGLADFVSAGCPRGVQPFALRDSIADAPWIDRDLVNWRLYAEKNGNFRRKPGTYIMSGRDCWHGKCTFCSWTTLYPRYRVRDVRDVVDEIETLVSKYGVREIMDDSGTFPVGPWLTDFCGEMISRGLNRKVRIDCNMRFGRLGPDDYRLMRRAGFQFVLFGVESANQETLDRFCKGLKVEDVEKGAKWATEAGLDVHVTFMFGHAWEGPDEIARTVALARRLLAKGWAKTLQCTLTIPYPGTPLFKSLKANDGLATLDWDEYDMRRAVTKTPRVSEDEIKRAIRQVYRGFLQPSALWHLFRRNLFDVGFYYRGLRYLLGHLMDFGAGAPRT
ncbi:MAG: radical SAM protein [Kiritimatiellae bacterium]|nr:radical SAM protein [Kiritimatiellia bacterium]